MNSIRWLLVVSWSAAQLALAAPVNEPNSTEGPAESLGAGDSRPSDPGAPRSRSPDVKPPGLDKSQALESSTGQKNLDLLLELQDRPKAALIGGAEAEAAKPGRRRSTEGATSQAGQPAAGSALLAPGSAEMTEAGESDGTERRRWSGSLGPQFAAENGTASESSGYKGDLHGAGLDNAPSRKFLRLLREYREWVVVAGVSAVLLMLATGAASRRHRRR